MTTLQLDDFGERNDYFDRYGEGAVGYGMGSCLGYGIGYRYGYGDGDRYAYGANILTTHDALEALATISR